MKNLRFISGLVLGLFLAFCFSLLTKCTEKEPVQAEKVPDSFTSMPNLSRGSGGNVYRLTVDNIQYLVVSSSDGVAMIKHQ